MRSKAHVVSTLQDVASRLHALEQESELIKTVLIVKEPGSVHAANAYDGLRKQVIAASGERHSHLAQLAIMAVAVSRASDVEDLRLQVREWMDQAGVQEVRELPHGQRAQDLFEDADGSGLDGAWPLEVVEPAYLDAGTGRVLRLGRARAAMPTVASAPAEAPTPATDLAPAEDEATVADPASVTEVES